MKLDNVAGVLKQHKIEKPSYWSAQIQRNKLLSSLWETSNNYQLFVDELLKHDYFDEGLVEKDEMFGFEDTRGRIVYALFSKMSENHWYRIRSVFGNKQFKTLSDIGSLLINNNVLIHNGYGDGVTRVAIFNKDDEDYRGTDFFSHMMNGSAVSLSGKIDIYDYDIKGEGEIILTINGDYFIYTYEGLIALVEI